MIRQVWTPGDDSTPAVIDTRPPDIGTFVVAVQRNGSWYVSPAYTALEYVRVVNHLPAAEYGSGRAAAAQLAPTRPKPRCGLPRVERRLGSPVGLAAPNEVPVSTAASTRRWPTRRLRTSRSTASRPRRTSTATPRGSRGGERCHGERIDLVARRPVLHDDGPGRTGALRTTCGTAGCSAASRSASASAGTSRATTHRCTSPRCSVTAAGTSVRSVPSSTSSFGGQCDDAGPDLRAARLYGEMSVDGTVTLGQPVHVSTPLAKRLRVYTVGTHAGQHIVGEITRPCSDSNPLDSVGVTVVQPDGTDRRLVQPVPRPVHFRSTGRIASCSSWRQQPLVVHHLRAADAPRVADP